MECVVLRSSLILLAVLLAAPQFARSQAFSQEVSVLQRRFSEEVERVPIDSAYKQLLIEQAVSLLSDHLGDSPMASQYFLLVDRNPAAQIVSLAFLNGETKSIAILGSNKTSTGNSKRIGFYETPIGVFKNTPENMSYQALGTKNNKGWRGLGAKGSRIWDLGWQKTVHPKGGSIDIRLLIHATDPDFGEPRLGKQDSKGCIHLSARFNRFLDRYGILDAEYEKSEKGKRFLKNNKPIALAGSLVVVIDSAKF